MYRALTAVIALLARLYPWPVEVDERLRDAVSFLRWEVDPTCVVRASYGGGILVVGSFALSMLFVPAHFRIVAGLGAITLGLLVVHLIQTFPRLYATSRRTSALGTAPDLVARATLRMRLSPTPERAAEFAASSGDGVLADSLARHVRASSHTARSGLSSFGKEWTDLFPSLRRSFALIVVAGRTPEHDRRQLLDRALSVVLDGTRDRMGEFAANVRAPVTALYAFGVLLPTAMVALLPAASAAGIVVTPLVVVALYNLLLPTTLVAASVRILVRRPVAFPPPAVTGTHPDVPDRTSIAVLTGIVTAGVVWVLAEAILPAWGPPIAALGFGGGIVLVIQYRPVVTVYDRIRRIEDSLPDALELVGRQVANGHATESAIAHVADELDGGMQDVLAAGARQQRQLQVGVREAFLGRYGALETVPSPRVRGSFELLSLATDEGRPAGTALLALATHLEELQRIEREARHSLAYVCRTLRSTALLFGPLVAGSTVALAEGISGEDTLPGGEHSLTWLGGPVGAYVLLLAVLLTALSVGLVRGFDRSLVGYRVGYTLVCATFAYLGSYLLVGAVL